MHVCIIMQLCNFKCSLYDYGVYVLSTCVLWFIATYSSCTSLYHTLCGQRSQDRCIIINLREECSVQFLIPSLSHSLYTAAVVTLQTQQQTQVFCILQPQHTFFCLWPWLLCWSSNPWCGTVERDVGGLPNCVRRLYPWTLSVCVTLPSIEYCIMGPVCNHLQ